MRDAIAGGIIGFILCACMVAAVELRGKLKHKLRGNYFDARAPFEIVRVGGPVEERSDAHVDRLAQRLGKISARRYADTSESS